MKHFLLLLLPLLSAIQVFAYDLNDFIISCQEMPNATYTLLEGDKLHEIFNSLASSPSMQKAPENSVNVDSLFRDVKKIDSIIFMDMNLFGNMVQQNATEDSTIDAFAEAKTAASNIDGYEEYVLESVNLATADVDQKEFDEMTAHLTDTQKKEFKELLNNYSFKVAIFGERTSEMEFKNPIFIFSFMSFTEILAMDGNVPIVNIDSWFNSIQL